MFSPLIVFLLCIASSNAKKDFTHFKKVGVLSQANCNSVKHLLHKNAECKFGPKGMPLNTLLDWVETGEVDAALISQELDDSRFDTVPCGDISTRAMFTKKNNASVRQQLDAAIVRLQMTENIDKYAKENPPFDYVALNTCRATEDTVDKNYPFAKEKKTITVASWKGQKWGNSGDYSNEANLTGFYPDYVNGLTEILQKNGVLLQRKWYDSMDAVFKAIQNGEVDATEPYVVVNSYHDDRHRSVHFDMGCTTLGLESNFVINKPSNSSDKQLVVGAIVGSFLVLFLLGFIVFLVQKERRGLPFFGRTPLILPGGSKSGVVMVDVSSTDDVTTNVL